MKLFKLSDLFDRLAVSKGVKQPAFCRCIDDAARWHPVLNIRDINGEIASTVDEFFCAIQRVNNQKNVGAGAV